MVPTPLMYFACSSSTWTGRTDHRSHNPPEDNGFKLMQGKSSLFGADIQALKRMIEARDFDLRDDGKVEEYDPLHAYIGFVRGNIRLARPDLKIAIDAGSGAGGPSAVAAMRAVGLKPVELLCEMDGHFPVHHPDPSQPENLELLRSTVLAQASTSASPTTATPIASA